MNKDERNSVGNDDCNDSNIEIEGYEFEMKDYFKNNKQNENNREDKDNIYINNKKNQNL